MSFLDWCSGRLYRAWINQQVVSEWSLCDTPHQFLPSPVFPAPIFSPPCVYLFPPFLLLFVPPSTPSLPPLPHALPSFTPQSPEPAQREVSQCGSFAAGEGELRVLWAGQDAASARGHHQPAGQGLRHPADDQLPAHAHLCQPGGPALEPSDGGRQQLQQRWAKGKQSYNTTQTQFFFAISLQSLSFFFLSLWRHHKASGYPQIFHSSWYVFWNLCLIASFHWLNVQSCRH